jgi:hypothetical protein
MSREAKVQEIASRLGIPDWRWLWALLKFESGLDPQKRNPLSSAKGLIQIMDATAADPRYGWNVPDSASLISLYPDFDSQMEEVVYVYLSKYTPLNTFQALCMAVFYPKFRYVDPATSFPDSVQAVNPGIVTVNDYLAFVQRRLGTSAVIATGGTAALGIVAALWYFWR